MSKKKCIGLCGRYLEENKDNFIWRSDNLKFKNECRDCCKSRCNKWYDENKDKVKEYYEVNKEEKKQYNEKWRSDHPEYFKQHAKGYEERRKVVREEWNKQHPDYLKEYMEVEENRKRRNFMAKERRNKNINIRLKTNISNSINKGLNAICRNKGGVPSLEILGWEKSDIQKLKDHLESLWEPWMNWDNYGIYIKNGELKWHIDHIVPQSKFDFSDYKQIRACWDLNNLRPLEAIKNIKKRNK